jgi:hypothetical protein
MNSCAGTATGVPWKWCDQLSYKALVVYRINTQQITGILKLLDRDLLQYESATD